MGAFRNFIGMSKGQQAAGSIGAMSIAGAAFDGATTYAYDRMENPENSKLWSATKGAASGAAWLFAEPLMWGITIGQGVVEGAKLAYQEADRNYRQEKDIKMHVRGGRGYYAEKDENGKFKRDQYGNKIEHNVGGTLGGNFQDSQNAYTMRQRQMDVLRQHRIATETVLGSEARQLHR